MSTQDAWPGLFGLTAAARVAAGMSWPTNGVFVIAEAGSCADGRLELAHELVEVAKRIGADAIKFQVWTDPAALAKRRHAEEYQHIYERYQMPLHWLPLLSDHANRLGLEFMATVYLSEDIALVAPFVKRFKIASFEAMDEEFKAAHRDYWKPAVVSVGMADQGEIEALMGNWNVYFETVGSAMLHCVSAYPTPAFDANLGSIGWMRRFITSRFGRGTMRPGFSDHLISLISGAVAVGAGAEVVEFHLRLDETPSDNPDFPHSRSPRDAMTYVANLRTAESMLGDGIKRAMPSEQAMLKYRVGGAVGIGIDS